MTIETTRTLVRDMIRNIGINVRIDDHAENCHRVLAFMSGLTDAHQKKTSDILAAVLDHLTMGAPLDAPAPPEQEKEWPYSPAPTPWYDHFSAVSDECDAQVKEACNLQEGESLDVSYSAYGYADIDGTGKKRITNNLSERAIEGMCVLELTSDAWSDAKTTHSEPMMDPTWLQVAVFCDRAIKEIGMGDHRFLEAVYPKKHGKEEMNGHPVFTLSMGS